MKKRLISMLLVLCMVFSLFPISILAADEESQTEEQTVFYVGEAISVTDLTGDVTISGYMDDEDWYVTDGLVLMYDGIYNAGMNEHDDTASSWAELTGNEDAEAIPTDGLTWSDYGLEVSDTGSGKASVAIDTGAFTYNAAFSGQNFSDMVPSDGSGYFPVFHFYLDSTKGEGHIGSVRGDGVILNYHAGINNVLSTNTSLKDNVVNSLAITSDGNTARSAFLNGKYVAQSTSNSYSANKGPDETYTFVAIDVPTNEVPNKNDPYTDKDGKTQYHKTLTLQETVYGLRVYNKDLSQTELAQNMAVDQARFENDSYTVPGEVTAGGETKALTECTFENGEATVGKTKVTADGELSVKLNQEGSYTLTFTSENGTVTKDVTIISEEDAEQADAVKQQIEALPDAEDLTIDDRDSVASAQAAYNQLSEAQKTRVGAAAKAKLDSCVEAIDKLAEGSLEITLTYNVNGGMLKPTEVTIFYKQNYTLDVPTRSGFRFDGWYLEDTDTQLTDANGNSLSPWMALEGATVTAHWTNNADIGATLEIYSEHDIYALARILDKNNKGTKADYERFGYSDVSDTAKANLQKATYVLQNDITLTDQNNTFYGIPDFMGVFDGNGKTINVNFALAGEWGNQAFGCLFSSIDGGTVKNINFTGTLGMKSGKVVTATTGLQDVAIVAGYTKNGATLENITSSVTMDLRFETTAGNTCVYAGAMVGRASGGSDRLINCVNTGDLTGEFTGFQANGGCRLGGLAGHAYAGVSFENCENSGDIDVSASDTQTLPSGMSGSGTDNVYTNCVLSGNVKSNGYAAQAYRGIGEGSTGNVIRMTVSGNAGDEIGYSMDETVSVTLDASNPTAVIDIPIENVSGITENNAFSYKQYLTVNGLRLDWYNLDSTELTLKLDASQAADLEVPFQTEQDALILRTEEDLLNLQKALNDGDADAISAVYALGGKTVADASQARAALKTAYYKLGNDIDVTDPAFTGIGKSGTAFSGHFDGQGNTVTLTRTADAEATSIYALFGELNSGANGDAVVENVTVTINADVQLQGSNSYTGALAGYIGGCELRNVKAIVEKLNVTGTTTYAAHIGGLAGQGRPDVLENVSVEVAGPMTAAVEGGSLYLGGLYGSGKVDADNPATVTFKDGAALEAKKQKSAIAIGGLIGYAAYGTIDLRGSRLVNESSAPLAISAETTGSVYAGGWVGEITDATSAADSWIYADATTVMEGEFSVTAESTYSEVYAGGIVGMSNQSFSVSISDYTNRASITGKHAGGLAGSFNNIGNSKQIVLTNCANEAQITGTAENDGYAGGLAGRLICDNIQLTNCKNTGAVQNSGHYEGGLAGNISTGGTVTITDCLNLGEVSSTHASSSFVGGFVGFLSNNADVTIKNSANGGALSASAKNSYLGGLIGYPQQATIHCEDALYLKTDTVTKGIALPSAPDVEGMIALDTEKVTAGATKTPIKDVLSAAKPEALTVSANAELDDTSLTYKNSGEQDIVFSWNGTKLYEKIVQVTASGTEYRVYCYFETVNAKGDELDLTDTEKIRVGLHPAEYGDDGWYVYGRLITETDLATKDYTPNDELFQTVLGELSGAGFSVHGECSGTFDENGNGDAIVWKALNWHKNPYKQTGYSQDGVISAYHLDGTVTFYNLTFDANAGSDAVSGNLPEASHYLKGADITVPIDLTREGYDFVGWTCEDMEDYAGGDFTMPEQDVTLKAAWKKQMEDPTEAPDLTQKDIVVKCSVTPLEHNAVHYKLTDVEGGYTVKENQPVEANGTWTYTVTLNQAPFIEAYTQTYGKIHSIVPDNTVELTWTWALVDNVWQWTYQGTSLYTIRLGHLNEYTVHFDANGGAGQMEDQSFLYSIEQPLSKNAFTRKGYAFNGWNTEKDGSGTAYADEEAVLNLTAENGGTVTLYAQWNAVSYTVAFHGNGGVLASNPKKDKATSDGTIGQSLTLKGANTFVREHYDFVGWSADPDAAEAEYTGSQKLEAGYPNAVAGETYDLYAVWKKHVYTVAISASLGGEKLGWIANANVTVDENLLDAVNAKLDELHAFQKKSILSIWEADKTRIVGYHADREHLYSDEAATVIAGDALIFDGTTTLVYINYLPNTDTPYTVEHYQEQLDSTYELVDTDELEGTTDTEAVAEEKSYTGFTADKTVEGTVASGNIAGDGSLVLKLYYTRNSYTVKFDSVEPDATTVSPVTVKYQQCVADVVVDGRSLVPTWAGHTFRGWYKEDGTAYTFDTQVTGDITLYAKWEEAEDVTITTPVYAFFKPVDANGNNITLDETTLSRVHLTYNTASKDWFTYGKMDARTKLALDAESYAKDSAEFASVVAELGTEAFVRYEGNKDFAGGSKITWNGLSKVDWEHYGYDVTDKSFHLDGALTFYSVRFNANAGEDNVSNMPSDGMYYDGEQLLVVASPMRVGYSFTGWYKDAECTERYSFTEEGITENLTLYAGWEEAKEVNPNVPVYAYFRPVNSKGETITLDDAALVRTGLVYNSATKDWFTYGKAEVFASLTDASYGADSAACKNAADALAGESFTRYEDNKDFAGTEKIDWFELKQVEAPHLSFAEETSTAYHLDGEITFFSVTFNANAGEDTVRNLPESGMYYNGEQLPAGIAPSRAGYIFGGWYDEPECKTAHTFTTDEVTEDINVYAKWTVSDPATITYKLTIDYVYKNGKTAADTVVLDVVSGAYYEVKSPSISGYKADQKVVSGTMPESELTVTVTYTRRTSSGSTLTESPNKQKADTALKFNTEEHFAYVNGYPDGTVRPEGKITRAEVAAILYRIMDEACVDEYKTNSSSYKDVARGDWFNTYVATLENAGVIVDTRTGGNFRPNEAITRAELATMLAQFADATTGTSSFKDVAGSHWASREIAIAAKMGWINGYPDGTFRPDQTITRAEMMAMVNRALERTPESEDDLLSGMKTWSDNAVSAWYYLDVQEATNGHTYTKSGTHESWKKLAN